MKRFICLILLCTLSCQVDDSFRLEEESAILSQPNFDTEKLLKGWEYITVNVNGNSFPYENNADCFHDFFGFRNNEGQKFQHEETYFTNDYCTGNTIVTRWEPTGDNINFYFGSQRVATYTVIELTEDRFVFSTDYDADQNGSIDHVIFSTVPYDPYHSYGPSGKTTALKSNAIVPFKAKTFPSALPIIF